MQKYYLYYLIDPNTNMPKYIGISNNPKRRYKEHLKETFNPLKSYWINSLKSGGQVPTLKIIKETSNIEQVIAWEIEEIKKHKEEWKLVNITSGGEYESGGGKAIKVYDLEGNFIDTYTSMTEWVLLHDMDSTAATALSAVCRRVRNYAYGHIFRYLDDIVTEDDVQHLRDTYHNRDPKHFLIMSIEGKILGEFNSLQEAEKQGFGSQGNISRVLRECEGYCSVNGNLVCYDTSDFVHKLERYRKGVTKGKNIVISQYSLTGDYIQTFYSYKEASDSVSISSNGIKECCKGNQKQSGGFQWRFGDSKDNIGTYKKTYNSSNRFKKIAQYDLNENLIKIWNSSREDAKELNTTPGFLAACAQGLKKSAKGYIWKYV